MKHYNFKKNLSKKKFFFFTIFLLSFIFLIFIFGNNLSFAATPKLVTKLSSAFTNIKSWILKLATPAAAVSVGVGLFMKKFSFGDEERMRTAKKVIRSSLVAYGVLLGLDLILNAIEILIK